MTLTHAQIRDTAADLMGLYMSAVADTVVGTTVTLSSLSHEIPNGERARDAYMSKDGVIFRRILTSLSASNQVTISGTIPTLGNGDTVHIYFLLNPEAMRKAILHELQLNSKEVRETVALVPGDNEYVLPSWVNTRGQVLDVIFRKLTGPSWAMEYKAPAFELLTNDHVVTLRLISIHSDLTGWEMKVRLRRYYDSTDPTTMPYELAVPMAQVAIYSRLRKQYGAEFVRRLFAEEAKEAERLYLQKRFEHEPPIQSTDFYQDFEWSGPDIPADYLVPSW